MKGFWKYFCVALLGIIAAMIFLVAISFERVSGDSMSPILEDGDIVLLNRLAYIKNDPAVGELVAFKTNVYSAEDGGAMRFKEVSSVDYGTVFVLSLNGAAGIDSRNEAIGDIPIHELEGRVEARILPISRAKFL